MLKIVFDNNNRAFFLEDKFLFYYGKNSFVKYNKYTVRFSLFPLSSHPIEGALVFVFGF